MLRMEKQSHNVSILPWQLYFYYPLLTFPGMTHSCHTQAYKNGQGAHTYTVKIRRENTTF